MDPESALLELVEASLSDPLSGAGGGGGGLSMFVDPLPRPCPPAPRLPRPLALVARLLDRGMATPTSVATGELVDSKDKGYKSASLAAKLLCLGLASAPQLVLATAAFNSADCTCHYCACLATPLGGVPSAVNPI